MTKGRRNTAIVLGLSAAAFVTMSALSGARADELSDLRVNQQLLQDRLDQLSQAFPGNTPSPGTPVLAGSFPRSFLIPGTDTSLRIAGTIDARVVYWAHGVSPNGELFGSGGNSQTCPDGDGPFCSLPSIPLKITGNVIGGQTLTASAANSRSSYFEESARTTYFSFDARTPTPWGEARAYIEMDFNASSAANDSLYSNLTGVSSGWIPRVKKAFGTLGGLQVGQDNGPFRDSSAEGETLTSGDEGAAGRLRTNSAIYTWTVPGGFTFKVAASNPLGDAATPNGSLNEDTTPIPGASTCTITATTNAVTATGAAATVTTNSLITNACLAANAELNPLQNVMPDWVTTQRWDQPWGHIQVGEALREVTFNDGAHLDQNYIGYGGSISGDLRPFYTASGSWAKDDIGWGVAGGNGIGSLVNDCLGVATNFGAGATAQTSNFTANRTLYDSGVKGKTIDCLGAHIDILHWWTDQLRTNIIFGTTQMGVDTQLISGQNCILTGGSAANNNCAAGGSASVNKILYLGNVNLIWSPVSFVDLGIEYTHGYRQTVGNLHGNADVFSAALHVKF